LVDPPSPAPSGNPPARPPEVGPLRILGKSLRLVLQLVHGVAQARRVGLPSPSASYAELRERSLRLHRISNSLLDHFGVVRRVSGRIPSSGLLVTNHVGFVDIMLLSAVQPMVFVSKSEVASWPVIGPIAAASGTLFVERTRRTDVARVNADLRRCLDAGLLVTLFPEGTSSDGAHVLPFQPSLLQPAVEAAIPVHPGHLSYWGRDRLRADDVAYFGDRDLLPCLMALVNRHTTFGEVHFGEPVGPVADRKTLASLLQNSVSKLAPPGLSRTDPPSY
jgi:1-acyl-sn-glycerol-3-phosphate acyltransferase